MNKDRPIPDLAEWSIIDMHTHIWRDSSVGTSSGEEERGLLEMADRYAIEALVVMPLFGGLCPTRDDIEAANRAVAALAERDPHPADVVRLPAPRSTRGRRSESLDGCRFRGTEDLGQLLGENTSWLSSRTRFIT